jgi:hypothetical protein
MEIQKEPSSGIAGFAIPNDPALYEVDESQLDFFSPMSEPTGEGENNEY